MAADVTTTLLQIIGRRDVYCGYVVLSSICIADPTFRCPCILPRFGCWATAQEAYCLAVEAFCLLRCTRQGSSRRCLLSPFCICPWAFVSEPQSLWPARCDITFCRTRFQIHVRTNAGLQAKDQISSGTNPGSLVGSAMAGCWLSSFDIP